MYEEIVGVEVLASVIYYGISLLRNLVYYMSN